MLRKNKLNLIGLHCQSCANIIESEIKLLKGVKTVEVNIKTNECFLEFDEDIISEQKIIQEIEKLGYHIKDGIAKKNKPINVKQWLFAVLIVFCLYIAFSFIRQTGLLSWLNLDQSKMGYGVAFLVGLVASLSTCLMVVGAVVISFCAKYQTKGNFYERNVKPHLLFQIGRIITFFILGGVLGSIGSVIGFSSSFMGWFTVLISLVIIWLALSIMGILPSMSKFGISLPPSIIKLWNKAQGSDHGLAPIIIGGLTFFLPCGFTQSMQLFAVSSGDFMTGAITLFMFALGTAPVLIGLGIAGNRFRNKKSELFFKVVGMILIIFSLYIISNGLALVGYNVNIRGDKKAGEAVAKDDVQIIEMSVNYKGFVPNSFNLKKDVPVKWIIHGDNVTGCTSEIIIPSLNIRKKIEKGENVVLFTPTETGTINFSCWMGMVRGKFIVGDGGSTGSIDSNRAINYSVSGSTCGNGSGCGGSCGGSCGCSR